MVQGAGYRALNPDLLLWVYATLADTARQAEATGFSALEGPAPT